MSFNEEDAAKAANLARIKISDEEKASIAQELNGIMQWIEQLSEIDDSDIEAVASVSGETLPMRKDEVTDGDKVEDILQNAPDSKFDCFVVPKVIDQG